MVIRVVYKSTTSDERWFLVSLDDYQPIYDMKRKDFNILREDVLVKKSMDKDLYSNYFVSNGKIEYEDSLRVVDVYDSTILSVVKSNLFRERSPINFFTELEVDMDNMVVEVQDGQFTEIKYAVFDFKQRAITIKGRPVITYVDHKFKKSPPDIYNRLSPSNEGMILYNLESYYIYNCKAALRNASALRKAEIELLSTYDLLNASKKAFDSNAQLMAWQSFKYKKWGYFDTRIEITQDPYFDHSRELTSCKIRKSSTKFCNEVSKFERYLESLGDSFDAAKVEEELLKRRFTAELELFYAVVMLAKYEVPPIYTEYGKLSYRTYKGDI